MATQAWLWTTDRRLPSTVAAAQSAIDELLDQMTRAGWSELDRHGVHLAAEESLVNAMKHGNRRDPSKSIQVRSYVSASRVRIEVTDQGTGFNPANVPDPRLDVNLGKPSGRGVLLIRKFMSRVEISPPGNTIIMEKDRSPP